MEETKITNPKRIPLKKLLSGLLVTAILCSGIGYLGGRYVPIFLLQNFLFTPLGVCRGSF